MSAAFSASRLPTGARPFRIARPGRLGRESGLAQVEALMLRLARGDRVERAGSMVTEQIQSGGKRLRARLALRAAEALEVLQRDVVGWAAAVELLHNATLVHDDIEDGDTVRRGKPTLWSVHGISQAINAGDLLLMLPFLAISETPGRVRGELASALAQCATRIVRGQVYELNLVPSRRFDWESYCYAATGKTGALIGLPIHGAALLAGRAAADAAALGEAFVPLGLLFQLQDDVVDLYGDKGRDLPGSDIYEGKVSALVVAHLERHPEDQAWLLDLLAAPRDQTDPRQVQRAITAFRSGGALAEVLRQIETIGQRVRGSAVLAEEPALHAVASDLARFAVEPISHLMPRRGA